MAVTLAPVVAESPVAGVQVYVAAPPAVSVPELPLHMLIFDAVIVGNAFTVTEVTTGLPV